jgi:hypothetical protein
MATHLDAGGYVFTTPAGITSLQDAQARQHDTGRLERISLGWSFYYSKHWSIQREDDEPLITTNYVRKFIDKKVEFLIGADFTLSVPKSLRNVTLPKLLEVWKDNGRQQLNYEAATEGAVTGDVFFLITVAEPDPITLKYDPFSAQRIVVQRLSSHQCFPVWDETKPNGRYGRPMRAFTIVRFIRRWNAAKQEDEEVRYVMTITASRIYEQTGDDREKISKNVLGEIPVVHIPNYPTAGSMFGMDDVTDLITLNKEHNEKSTDVSDSINYNSAPITVIIGAKAKNLERSPRAIWAIPVTGASVSHLKLEGDLVGAVNYLEQIKDAMHDIGGVPKSAFGDSKHLSGTSGVALAMTLQPLIDERNRKRATYEPGYERVNYYILRYAEIFHGLRLPFGLCAKCGGKIAIFYLANPDNPRAEVEKDFIQARRCYQVDPDTLTFLDPTKKSLPVESIVQDPPVRVDGQSLENVPEAAAGDYGEQEPNIPEKFDLPLVEHVLVDDEGNELPETRTTIQEEQDDVFAIPMNCDAHSFLNPFTTEVLFNDTFPKDKKEQMDLFAMQLNLKLVSRAYVMTQIGIEQVDEMLKAVEQEQQKEFERQIKLNAALNGVMAEDVGMSGPTPGGPGPGRPPNPPERLAPVSSSQQ